MQLLMGDLCGNTASLSCLIGILDALHDQRPLIKVRSSAIVVGLNVNLNLFLGLISSYRSLYSALATRARLS